MRKSIPLLLLVLDFANPTPLAAQAATAPDVKGLWLTMDYPVAAVRAGEEARFSLSLVNHGLAPQRAKPLSREYSTGLDSRAARRRSCGRRSRC
jgi:hypothetical protein